ncbi:MAG: putative permease [Modestobacter sp.]|nr:putative permease [Modestobacter sp.]
MSTSESTAPDTREPPEARPPGDRGSAGPRPGVAPGPVAPADPGWPTRRIFGAAFTAGVALVMADTLLRAIGGVAGELILIVLALVFALGLDPMVSWLGRHGWRRSWGVAAVTIGFLLIVVGVFAVIIPPIVRQVEQLSRALPGLLQQLQDRSSTLGRLNARYHLLDSLKAQFSAGAGGLPLNGVLNVGLAVFGTLTAAVTVLVLTVYFLANLPTIRRVAYHMFPGSRRDRARELGDEISARVGGYVLGNLLTSAIAGLGTFLFLEIVHVPYAAALGVLVAVLDLIPVVGSTIGGILVTLVALSVSTTVAIASLVFYVAYRLLEDYLLVPRVMNRAVDVPPVLTIVALIIGGALLGIVGAFLAIPAAAAVQLVVTRVVWARLDSA